MIQDYLFFLLIEVLLKQSIATYLWYHLMKYIVVKVNLILFKYFISLENKIESSLSIDCFNQFFLRMRIFSNLYHLMMILIPLFSIVKFED